MALEAALWMPRWRERGEEMWKARGFLIRGKTEREEKETLR